jgi:molecular chaperone DnaK (HSP70)
VIGIDLGTTNSCVAVMEGKVSGYVLPRTCSFMLFDSLKSVD